jgi:serine/threonine protein kinase
MEYIDGSQLFKIIEQRSIYRIKTTQQELLKLASTLFETLKYIHSKQIAHRDIKAENIMITLSGDIKIIDFGLSKSLREGVVGTLYYLAPELFDNSIYDLELYKKADIWAIGILLYEYYKCQVPFDDNLSTSQVVKKIKRNDFDKTCEYSLINTIIQKCLIYKYEDRPSAEDMYNFISKSSVESGVDTNNNIELEMKCSNIEVTETSIRDLNELDQI